LLATGRGREAASHLALVVRERPQAAEARTLLARAEALATPGS
jgi:hypothetical protein